VTLLGPRGDLPELLAACDLLVLPSRHEGDPAVVLEAMASARPVVVTPAAAASVEADGTGLIVPQDDPSALAQAIIRLLRDPEAARQMGVAGRAVVEERHDIRAMVSRYESVWEGLLREWASSQTGRSSS
jgi:glycosyltransferase involved in cell wall biosynthesis